jgi:hypothetical protein
MGIATYFIEEADQIDPKAISTISMHNIANMGDDKFLGKPVTKVDASASDVSLQSPDFRVTLCPRKGVVTKVDILAEMSDAFTMPSVEEDFVVYTTSGGAYLFNPRGSFIFVTLRIQ